MLLLLISGDILNIPRKFYVEKNLLDMGYQKTMSFFSITAIALATFLITLWFSQITLNQKISFTYISLISGFVIFSILWNRLELLKSKAEKL